MGGNNFKLSILNFELSGQLKTALIYKYCIFDFLINEKK